MTAILAVFGDPRQSCGEATLRHALAADGHAPELIRLHAEPGATVAVAIDPTRATDHRGLTRAFAIDDDIVVIADATLYHVADLRRAIGSTAPATASASHLILAAYRTFGPACVERLEGDFAFVIWDRLARRVLCARDFAGRRPLYHTAWRGGLAVASSLASLAALPGMGADLNMAVVGADASGLLFSLDDETCMTGVSALRAGWRATWSWHNGLRGERVWHQPTRETNTLGFDEAAEQLRALLVDAVGERLAPSGTTAVWMSGGRDSTAVFGAGMQALAARGTPGVLQPISRSHPVGDPGREDESIIEIARQWNVVPRWIEADSVPMFAGALAQASARPEPFAQPFENLTRALADGGRAAGATIALDGYGGDFLFQLSHVYLADLVARGQVIDALRDWRAIDGGRDGMMGFGRWAVLPLFPAWVRRAIGAVRRGASPRGTMERTPPPWIDARFLRQHDLVARAEALSPERRTGRTMADRETGFYLEHPYFARVNAMMGSFARAHGVELRSPLLDERIVRFALSRPAVERNSRGDRKRLLRAAMRGVLPDSVTAYRRWKTGTLTKYFAREMNTEGLALLSSIGPAPTLAAAGIVTPSVFAAEVQCFRANPAAYQHTESLFCTLQAELWLRARVGAAPTPRANASTSLRASLDAGRALA